MNKVLLTGNEAIARGAYEAGVKVCSAYPGTPSTEIFENLPLYKDALYCEWAPNEKVATEVAYGASIAGVAVHMLGGILGLVIMLLLGIVGGKDLLTPVNVLLYELIWMIPGLLITEWTRSV